MGTPREIPLCRDESFAKTMRKAVGTPHENPRCRHESFTHKRYAELGMGRGGEHAKIHYAVMKASRKTDTQSSGGTPRENPLCREESFARN